jgi:hypothetical protein
MCECPGCWKQQREISKDFIKIQTNAKALSINKNKKVIITKEAEGYMFGCFEGDDLPDNTIEVIIQN